MIKALGTGINPKQIKISNLFTVERVLASRGVHIIKEGEGDDTIIGKKIWSKEEAEITFNIFNNEDKRKELLEYIENQKGVHELSNEVSGFILNNGYKNTRQAYSSTYEWYVGELLVRRFQAFSSSYGVTVNNINRNSDGGTSGDFDVLSILGDMSLLYLECKSGSNTQKSIRNTLERSISLHCVASVFFQQRIHINNLKQLLNFSHPIFGDDHSPEIYKLSIKGVDNSDIYKWYDCYFIDASDIQSNIENKIRCVLRIIEANRAMRNIFTSFTKETYKSVGYECVEYQI